MSRDWESVVTTWSRGPSQTEEQFAENAVSQIRKAISDSAKLARRDIRVFLQGSYKNRVNVRQDSDVDVGVLCFDTYYPGYQDDNVKASVEKREVPGTYAYSIFKSEVEEA